MKLRISRLEINANDTFGVMFINGEFFCCTGEPTNRMIPAGEYKVKVTYSPRFKRNIPVVCDVPHRSGIRIHSGNVPHKDSTGCILLGAKVDYKLINSRDTCERFYKMIENEEEITLKIQ